MRYVLDPLSPTGVSKENKQGYNPYFAGGPGKPSLLDSVNGKHGAVQIAAGSGVTIDNSAKDTITISSSGGEGSGDVVGPASATDQAIARFDGGGQLLQDSSVTINDNGQMNIQATSGVGLTIVAAGTDPLTDSMALALRAFEDEGGTKLIFWKHPTSTDLTDRVGQITAHGIGSGSEIDEMAFYTTNDTDGTMENRFKVLAKVAANSSPLILTGTTGLARSSGGLIKIGEDVESGGTSKVKFESFVGIMTSGSPSYPLDIVKTSTDTSGTVPIAQVQNTISPASNSTASFRALYFQNIAQAATGITLNTLYGGYFENRLRQDGTITTSTAGYFMPGVLDSSSAATQTVTNLTGVDARLYLRASGTSTISVTDGIALDTTNAVSGSGSTWTNLTYLKIGNAGAGTITTQIGVDIGTLTRGTTDIGIRIAKADTYSLQLSDTGGTAAGGITFGTDTNLYRIAADVLASDDSARVGGYLRVGSTSAPTNTSAGDLTVGRLNINSNLSGTAFGTGGHVVRIDGTLTATASGANYFAGINNTFTPASTSASEIRALAFENYVNPAAGVDVAIIRGGYFNTRLRLEGTSGTVNGVWGQAVTIDSSSPATVGTLGFAQAVAAIVFGRPSGTSTITITTAIAYDVPSSTMSAGVSIGTFNGLRIQNPNAPTALTTLIGVDLGAYTRGSATNIGLRIGEPSGGVSANYALQLSGTSGAAAGGITFGVDTTLYRSAANTLKTDDTFDAVGYSVAGAAGASGTFTTADAKTVTVTNGLITSIV